MEKNHNKSTKKLTLKKGKNKEKEVIMKIRKE